MKPTKQDIVEWLQDRISKNYITNIDQLKLEISCAEYDGDELIDEWEDVLSPMEWNVCDKCGDLYPSEELCWLDCIVWEEDNPDDQATLKGIAEEDPDYCAVCYSCLSKLKEKGYKKGE